MKTVDWYFDFISPFSYLQSTRLEEIAAHAHVHARPVLFAGLLNHWGHVGPAEMPTKRTWTFEHCAWLAHRHGIPFTFPPQHPFNPLPLLRLALAVGADGLAPVDVVARLFQFVWAEGHVPNESEAWDDLMDELQVDPEQLQAPIVKEMLHANGERAIAAGVFGVPTSVCQGRQFWGFDATEMLLAFLADDPFFRSEAYAAAATLPAGAQRTRPARPS